MANLMSDRELKQRVQQQFGQNPEGYVTSATHAQGEDLPRLLELLQPQPDWLALDIATGGGHTARMLAPHVRQVIASDLTLKMLRAARQHLADSGVTNARFYRLDAQALPFATGAFDLVTCRIAPHHFPAPANFVQEAARVTRPGGLVAVIDQIVPKQRKGARYVNAFERLRDPSHAWAYSLPRWTGFFKDAGLEVLHAEPFTRRHQLTDWADRMRCAPDVVIRLRAMLVQAPEAAAEWLQAEIHPAGDASFLIHQALLLGRKPI